MKYLVILLFAFAQTALASGTSTTIQCASTNAPSISGSKTFSEDRLNFSDEELKSALLGSGGRVAGPSVVDRQDLQIQRVNAFTFEKAIYFTLRSSNHVDLYVFCTISQEAGL